jgi:HPt (histidine-containing phosphotransfer) domain-containing protein
MMNKPEVSTPACHAVAELFDEPQLEEIRLVTGNAFGDLVAQFQANAIAAFTEIEAAISVGDAERLRKAAHRFKGSAATLGAKAVAELAGHIETAGRSGAVNDGAKLLTPLHQVFEQSCSQLQAMLASGVA